MNQPLNPEEQKRRDAAKAAALGTVTVNIPDRVGNPTIGSAAPPTFTYEVEVLVEGKVVATVKFNCNKDGVGRIA